jgi:hypothetical protein
MPPLPPAGRPFFAWMHVRDQRTKSFGTGVTAEVDESGRFEFEGKTFQIVREETSRDIDGHEEGVFIAYEEGFTPPDEPS